MAPIAQPHHPPRVAAVGLARWDDLLFVDQLPAPGSLAIVRKTASLPGGTVTSAVALKRLGAEVELVALVGDDAEGQRIRSALAREGVSTRWLTTVSDAPTSRATVIVSANPPERTIYCRQGARLSRGNRLDVDAIFAHDVVLLDLDDVPLRRFLVDLPAHTRPTVCLLGTLTHLVSLPPRDAIELALGHDVLVGNEREVMAVTGQPSFDAAVQTMQQAMTGANLRACAVPRDVRGATAFTPRERWDVPAIPMDMVDPTSVDAAFAAAIAYAVALRWDWPIALRLANAVAALAARAIGGQPALPTLAAAAALLDTAPSCPT